MTNPVGVAELRHFDCLPLYWSSRPPPSVRGVLHSDSVQICSAKNIGGQCGDLGLMVVIMWVVWLS